MPAASCILVSEDVCWVSACVMSGIGRRPRICSMTVLSRCSRQSTVFHGAVNVSLEARRQKRRLHYPTTVDRLPERYEEPTSDEMERLPYDDLKRLIAELPDGYRTVFNLYCIEELSHREIAERLGISEKTSSSQLFRAKALLARRIKEYVKDK